MIHIYISYDNDTFFLKKDTLQIIAKNKQQSPYLRVPVESYKNLQYIKNKQKYRVHRSNGCH